MSTWRCVRGGSGPGGELRGQEHLAKFRFYGRPVLCSRCDAFAPLLSKGAAAVIFMRGVLQQDLMA